MNGKSSRWFTLFSLAVVALLTALHMSMIRSYAGAFTPIMDDTYIHFVFARSIAEGRLFEFIPGEGYSRGATSFLWPIVLAGLLRAGVPESSLGWVAALLAGVLYWLSALGVFAWIRRLTGREGWAWAAALFYLASGTLHYAVYSGMECALFAALLAAALAWMPLPGRPARLGLFLPAAALLALTRPEGLIAAGLMCLALFILRWRRTGFASALPFALPPLAGLVKPVMDFAMTGSLMPSGLRAKAAFAPQMAGGKRVDLLDVVYNGLLGIRFRLGYFGGQYAEFLYGLVWLAVILGLAAIYRAARRRGAGWESLAGVLPVVAASATLCFILPVGDWQYNRYFLHLLVVYLPLMAVGVAVVDRRLGARGWLTGTMIFLSVLTIPHWSQVLGRSAREMRHTHHRVRQWLGDNTAPGERVAVNDAGFLPWLDRRPIDDLIGLISPHFEGTNPAIVWERIQSLPADRRPAWFIIYPGWFPQLVESGFLVPVERPRVYGQYVMLSPDKTIYRPDWSWAGRGDAPIQQPVGGLRLVDRLNVCERDSERAHHYRKSPFLRGDDALEWTYTFKGGPGSFALDSGRYLRGAEEFDLAAEPGRDLTLVNRFKLGWLDHSPVFVDVAVDGAPAGVWRHSPWVTLSHQFQGPDKDGRWIKGRTGSLYIDTSLAGPDCELILDIKADAVPSTVTQTLTVRNADGRVLAEDRLTSGAARTVTARPLALRRAGQAGYEVVNLECSYLNEVDEGQRPPDNPPFSRAVQVKRIGLRTGGEGGRTIWRELKTPAAGRDCESAFCIPGALIRKDKVRIRIATNTRWSADFHSSFHYWAYADAGQ